MEKLIKRFDTLIGLQSMTNLYGSVCAKECKKVAIEFLVSVARLKREKSFYEYLFDKFIEERYEKEC